MSYSVYKVWVTLKIKTRERIELEIYGWVRGRIAVNVRSRALNILAEVVVHVAVDVLVGTHEF